MRFRRQAPSIVWLTLTLSLGLFACLPEPTAPVERPTDLLEIKKPNDSKEKPIELINKQKNTPAGLLGGVIYGVFAQASEHLLRTQLMEGEDLYYDNRPTSATLIFTSNTRGEAEARGKKPKGGIARRLTAILSLSQEAPIIIEGGDALSKSISYGSETANKRSIKLLQAIAMTKPDLMLINLRELSLPTSTLLDLSKELDLPLLSSNLVEKESRKPLFETEVVVERNGLRFGFVGLTSPHRTNPRFLKKNGLALLDLKDALAKPLSKLDRAKVDALVLVSGMGLKDTTKAMETWPETEALPDIVLVSGSARLTKEPQWSRGRALLEAGDRGRQLLVLRFYADENDRLSLTQSEHSQHIALTKLLSDLNAANKQGRKLGKSNNTKAAKKRSLKKMDSLIKGITSALPIALALPIAPKEAPGFEVEIIDLDESLSEHEKIKKLYAPE